MQLRTGQNALHAFSAGFCLVTQKPHLKNVAAATEGNHSVQVLGLLKVYVLLIRT